MKKTILIVDDFDSIRSVMAKFLASKGFETREAANGLEAYEVLKNNPKQIDLVITDLNMPELNGLELLAKIKASENQLVKQKPVIMLTSDRDVNKMKEAKKLGLNAWINKPYKTEQFMAQINQLLSS